MVQSVWHCTESDIFFAQQLRYAMLLLLRTNTMDLYLVFRECLSTPIPVV